MANTKHSPAPWHVRPDYGKANVYYLWDKNDNYHATEYLTPEVMDANAALMASAPERSMTNMTNTWGTLTLKQVEVLREFLARFIAVCPDVDGKIDPADKKRIATVKKILNA
jgi:hypothetical protein